MPLDFNDPTTQLIIGAGLIVLLLLLLSLRAVSRLTKAAEPLSYQINALGQRVQALGEGQERLAGGLHHVSEAQAKQQTNMLQLMEKRLADVQLQMNENLQGSARRTAHSLGELQQRLTAIDKAQENITKLSGDVLSLQDILSNKQTDWELNEAARQLRTAVKKHIKDISEKYIIEGETADGALMFLPSEAVYAELHANFSELVREGFTARVWIVSPTTCMATLNTMRAILKDARMREQAGAIRRELGLLYQDVDRLGTRVENLDRHFAQAAKDITEIKISADKAGKRARRLDNFDFEEIKSDTPKMLDQN
ncbi:MAG: DNA recombination protein RmuC [Rhodobacteraceae bacterium]|nr:DNA recombination protein RmuC [Paracoccaceae bacterium]